MDQFFSANMKDMKCWFHQKWNAPDVQIYSGWSDFPIFFHLNYVFDLLYIDIQQSRGKTVFLFNGLKMGLLILIM